MLDYARTRGWVDDEHGAVRGHVERRAAARSRASRTASGVSGALRDAVLLSFDNLGEAADLERHGAPPRGAAPFGHRRAAARAGCARRAGPARDLLRRGAQRRALSPGAARHRGGRPRGRAARLAPRALGRAVTRRGGRAAGPRRRRARGAGPRHRGLPAAGRRAGGAHDRRTGRARPALVLAGRRARGAPGRRRQPALPLAGGRRLPPPGVLHRSAHSSGRPGGRRLAAGGRRCAHRRARRAGRRTARPHPASVPHARGRRGGAGAARARAPGRAGGPRASAGSRRGASSRRWWARSCRADALRAASCGCAPPTTWSRGREPAAVGARAAPPPRVPRREACVFGNTWLKPREGWAPLGAP